MARVRKVHINKLSKAIQEAIDEWGIESTIAVKEVTKRFGKEGTKLLKDVSKETFGGRKSRKAYWKQWTNTVIEETPTSIQVSLHSKKYQLPHLLEYSHATGPKKGGHFLGRPHIERAEKTIIEQYEKEIKNALS